MISCGTGAARGVDHQLLPGCVSLDSLTFIVSGRELEHRILSEAKAPPDTTFAARRDPMANMMIWLWELKPGVISLLEGDFAMILASRRLAYSSSSISVAIAYDVISSPQLDRVSPNESTCTYFGIMIPARWNRRRNAHSVEVEIVGAAAAGPRQLPTHSYTSLHLSQTQHKHKNPFRDVAIEFLRRRSSNFKGFPPNPAGRDQATSSRCKVKIDVVQQDTNGGVPPGCRRGGSTVRANEQENRVSRPEDMH